MIADDQLATELERVLEPPVLKAKGGPFQIAQTNGNTLQDQLRVFERAAVELRRRMQEERARIVNDFERRLSEYEATVRANIVDMKASHERELQAHDLIVKRFQTIG